VKGRPNRWTGGLGGFAQRAQDKRDGREQLLSVDAVVFGDLAGHNQLGDQDEEAHEVAAGAAGLLRLGAVVPEGLPLGPVRAVVALEDGMRCWLGELTTTTRVRLLDLMPVPRSRTRPGVSRTTVSLRQGCLIGFH
jgi:hypothetical protein